MLKTSKVLFFVRSKLEMDMADDDSIFNQAFDCDDSSNEEEFIVVSDFISFMQTVRGAPAETITEMCNYFDDTAVMPFKSIIKLIQNFVEEKRKSFSEDSEEEQVSEFCNTDSNLEGCGGDISTVSALESDIGEMVLKNKNLSHSNSNLRTQNMNLRKQLEACDFECEAQRKKIAELDKDLRQFQGVKPDVQHLLKEKDEMQNKNVKLLEELSFLKNREKILKEEADDYRVRLLSVQDRSDTLSVQIDQLRKENEDLKEENLALKASLESVQLMLENRDDIIAMKTKECSELTVRIQDYESVIEELKEEKEALTEQVRDVQMEYSIYMKPVTGPGPETPLTSNIQHELQVADYGNVSGDYASPICGTDYMKGSRRSFSPITASVRQGRLLFLSPSSPREKLLKRTVSEVSIQTTTPELEETETQTPRAQKLDAMEQTDTVPMCHVATQVEMKCLQKESVSIQEEDKVFDKQSSMIQESIRKYQSQIVDLQQVNDDLQQALEIDKNRSQYLTSQVGANRAKIHSLQDTLSKEQEKVSELTQINMKFCSSKLDMWWEDHQKDLEALGNDENDFRMIDDEQVTSRLLDAILLAGTVKPKKLLKWDSNILHGQDISQMDLEDETDSKSCKTVIFASDADRLNLAGRVHVLKICKTMLEEAITQKVDLILDIMREVMYSDDYSGNDDVLDLQKVNKSFSFELRSLQSLCSKLGSVQCCIGAREEEVKMQAAIKVISGRLLTAVSKYKAANRKLQLLFDASLDCQCFSAIKMLHILKDTEHNEEESERKVTLHSQRLEEITDISGPIMQNHMKMCQALFDDMETNVLARLWKMLPSRRWSMFICFVVFAYCTFHWEDYRVPEVY